MDIFAHDKNEIIEKTKDFVKKRKNHKGFKKIF